MTGDVVVIEVDRGTVKDKHIRKGKLEEIVKQVVVEVLELWKPEKSDLIVMRHEHDIEVNLPLTTDEYERYSKYNLRRSGQDKARFTVPLYVISYDNEWVGEDVVDNVIRIVAPYIDERVVKELEELGKSTTTRSTSS